MGGGMKRWTLWLMARAELVDTSVRVCQENQALVAENAELKAMLRRSVVRCQRVTRELAEVREFLSVVGEQP